MALEQRPSHTARTRVLLVDDHPITREGLKQLIERRPNMAVCGEAQSAAEALRAVDELSPDLAVVDISLRDSNGVDLIMDLLTRGDHGARGSEAVHT